MARGRVPGKSKAVEEATEDATKQVTPAPPSKKSKGNEESTGKKLVKITIEHCNSSQKFKRMAKEYLDFFTTSFPGVETETNPEKPRRGSFNIR